jgi:hypothetical protein
MTVTGDAMLCCAMAGMGQWRSAPCPCSLPFRVREQVGSGWWTGLPCVLSFVEGETVTSTAIADTASETRWRGWVVHPCYIRASVE